MWEGFPRSGRTRVAGSHVECDHTLRHTLGMASVERVTVTLTAELVEGIDRIERNRSRFIAEAVEHELARRRRDTLVASLQQPHPESIDLSDANLGDWTAGLQEDAGLVDAAGGTPVSWIEGRGWVKASA